jgi:integrase/recombinase XerD
MEILFVLRLNPRDKTKLATIYCRLTLEGQRAGDFSTFEHVLPDEWHAKGQLVISGTEEARLTNEALSGIRNDLKGIYNRLKIDPEVSLSAVGIKAEYLRKEIPSRTFADVFMLLMERKKLLKRAKGTIDGNFYKFSNLKAFLKAKGKEKLLPGQFTETVADEFEFWLRGNLPSCGIEHVAKHLQLVKETLKLAVKLGDINRNPLEALTLKRGKPKKSVFLTLQELRLLEASSFVNPTLQMTADVFIFCCYTGLSYNELNSFSPEVDIRPGIDGHRWIYKSRGKTDEQAVLPLFDGAKRILAKHSNNLPYIRNDHYNNYIKQVVAIVGLNIHVTTHTARKTAANIWHNEGGLPMDDVALMMGHADPETTRKYYVQTDSRKLAEAADRLRILLA